MRSASSVQNRDKDVMIYRYDTNGKSKKVKTYVHGS